MKRLFTLSIVIAILFSACSLFQSESFTGEWELKLLGDYEDQIEFLVKDDMTFSVNTVVDYNGRDFDVKFSGKISEVGKLVGLIYVQGQQMGELNGKMNYENGEGKWNAAGMGGTWSAVKKK